MGCLGFLLELIVEGFFEGWYALMQWIIPEKMCNKRIHKALKIFTSVFSGALFVSMLFGLIAMFQLDPVVSRAGKYLFFIPLGIAVAQAIMGLIAKLLRKKKK